MDEIGLERARDILGEIVDKAALAGEAYTITRHGKPRAALVGYDWYIAALTCIAAGTQPAQPEALNEAPPGIDDGYAALVQGRRGT